MAGALAGSGRGRRLGGGQAICRTRCATVSISDSGYWSGRGAARNAHQTLRHAVMWPYDHLDDAEKVLLDRCSVFAGGFDLQSACAVAGSDDLDEYAILDLLDALVRKSLLVVERSSVRTRFSMLETIRQFAQARGADSPDLHPVPATTESPCAGRALGPETLPPGWAGRAAVAAQDRRDQRR